jgi:hypothetical protein
MVNTADVKLDEVAIQQMIWKNNRLLSACLSIARHSVDRLSLWPDEICFDFPIAPADKNLIGIAWRLCISKLKIIEKTGSFRSSKAEASNGRVIFQYRSTNKSLARAFMERYGKQGQLAAPQIEMAL